MEPQSPNLFPTSSNTPGVGQQTSASLEPRGLLKGLESLFIKLFSAPAVQLPDYVKDMIARLLPWMTIVMCVIMAPLVLVGLALGGFLGFITSFYEINKNPFYWVTMLLLVAQFVLMIVAVPKLLRNTRAGWSLLFTTEILGIVMLIANIFAQFVSPLLALLVGTVTYTLTLYVLFQTRSFFSS